MNGANGVEILRAAIFHTPGNLFAATDGLVAFADGALAIANGRIIGSGDYRDVAALHPDAAVRDLRGGYIIPGLIDSHVHFPQVRVLGGLGYSLLAWLEQRALPEEARLADTGYAATIAREFVEALVSHGTTAAMVFGSHFAGAMEVLFTIAEQSGLRICSGLVLSDRSLLPELRQSPEAAYRDSHSLIERFHGKGRLLYAVTPRFALSASEEMLETCGALLGEDVTLRFTTHINENMREIEEVAAMFPNERDYLAVYERYDLLGGLSVLAHNIHATDGEIERLAATGTSIASCPRSNAALGSGIFPLRKHVEAGVCCALGTDVGGGTGFGMLQEGLQMYLMQRVAPMPVTLTPAQLLYLATRAGAQALGLEDEIGDFETGKAADLVYLKPPDGGLLAGVLERSEDQERVLAALFALAGPECVREVRVAGDVVFRGQNVTIEEINRLDRNQFKAALGAIFEDSPWVAERAWRHLPFDSLDQLCERMNGEVEAARQEEQIALLRAHPDLGTRARVSPDSAREQAGAGLDRLTANEYARLVSLNGRYRAKFGFPFLYAVKGSDKIMILEALAQRVENKPEEEFLEALRQVYRIARFRLEEKIER